MQMTQCISDEVQIFWTLRSCDLVVLIARSNSLLQALKLASPSCAFTRERYIFPTLPFALAHISVRCLYNVESISVRSRRRWVNVPVQKCGVSVPRLVSDIRLHFPVVVADASTFLGMYALRERRQHVTQEDFEFAVAKVLKKNQDSNTSVNKLFS